MNALCFQDVAVRYGSKIAIQNVSFLIPRGEITALMGPSGCGKSSLLQSINRLTDLIPGCQVSGTIALDGENILNGKINPLKLRRQVGMIFQQPTPFPFSIAKNLEFPLREHGYQNKKEILHITQDALESVGLWGEVKDRLNSPAQQLSGGQQQRLCIARALALKPDILLLDEPCSALDPISSGVVEDLIVRLREHYTLVVVTHNLAQARRIADTAAFFWLEDGIGKLIEVGRAEQIFHSPETELAAAYIQGVRG